MSLAADVYRQVLGREPENQQVVDAWNAWFGDTVDPSELRDFYAAAAPELAANQALPQTVAEVQQAYTPTAAPAPTGDLSVTQLFQQVLGRTPSQDDLTNWTNALGNTVDANELANFVNTSKYEISTKPQALQDKLNNNISVLTGQVGAPTNAAAVRPTTVNDLYQTFYGTAPDTTGGQYWSQGFGSSVDPTETVTWLRAASKDPLISDKSTGLTVDQAYKTYLGFEPDAAAKNYWTGNNPDAPLTVSQLAAITSQHYGLNPQDGGGLFGSGIGPDVGWTNVRDNLQAAAVVGGNYLLPGSSLLTGNLVTQGAKEALSSDVGKVANIAAGVTGGLQGNMANYGKVGEALGVTEPATSSLTAEQLAIANATSDPIAAANALKGWTIADIPYLQSIGASADLISLAQANNANLSSAAGGGPSGGTVTPAADTATATTTNPLSNLTSTQLATLAKAGINVAGILAGGAALGGLTGLTGGGTGSVGMLTPQDRSGVSSGSAQYSPEYYQAIQAKYNQMMPQQPRDVTTDLKSWYETKYAPKVAQ